MARASLEGMERAGSINLYPPGGPADVTHRTASLGSNGLFYFGGNGANAKVILFPSTAMAPGPERYKDKATLVLDATGGDLWLGGNGQNGNVGIFPAEANDIQAENQASIMLRGNDGSISLSAQKDFGGTFVHQ